MRPRWLLIGNSRWHWAAPGDSGPDCWHEPAPGSDAAVAPGRLEGLVAWAAVGPLAAQARLDADRRLHLEHVPLAGAPPWLGIDRALAAWQATVSSGGEAVLVVDAGTVLSVTLVDAGGRFRGGRLMAGLALQLRAMADGTALLPRPGLADDTADAAAAEPLWPAATQAAMVSGVRRGLAAAVVAAVIEAPPGPLHLWLTGGDGAVLLPAIAPRLGGRAITLHHEPDLCLRAMAQLRPVPPLGGFR
ncbi:MAG: type III pantothenate kinase [Cyanobacteriota bacterium]